MPSRRVFLQRFALSIFAAVPAARALISAAPAFAVDVCVDIVCSYTGTHQCTVCTCADGSQGCTCGWELYSCSDAHGGGWCYYEWVLVCRRYDGSCCYV
jgi:hypothetical protein